MTAKFFLSESFSSGIKSDILLFSVNFLSSYAFITASKVPAAWKKKPPKHRSPRRNRLLQQRSRQSAKPPNRHPPRINHPKSSGPQICRYAGRHYHHRQGFHPVLNKTIKFIGGFKSMATKKKNFWNRRTPVNRNRYVGRRNSAGRYCST